MREVRVTTPQGMARTVAQLAFEVGIEQATVFQVYVHGPEQSKEVVSLETATPTAKLFLDALMQAPFYDPHDFAITSRSVRNILAHDEPAEVTRPFVQPTAEIWQELWQASHLTPSYVVRIFLATGLLALGMIQNNLILLISALLFTQFLQPLMGVGFGLLNRRWALARQAATTLLVGTLLALLAGAVVAGLAGGPLLYDDFGSLPVNLLVSSAVGLAAGLALADDAGERQLVGLAAAAQYAKYPVWFGTSLVLGFPDAATTGLRLAAFLGNTLALLGAATLSFYLLRLRLPTATRTPTPRNEATHAALPRG